MVAWSLAAGVLAACGSEPRVSTDALQVDYSTGTHVVLLGTGTPNAEPDRSGTAVAVLSEGKAYLVDAGPGVVRRASAGLRRGMGPLRVPDLDIVFLTHLHSDHTVGLPDLMLTPWVLGRDRPLRVLGPPGTAALMEHLLAAYSEDIRIRTSGLEPSNDTGYRVHATEVDSGVVFEDERVKVTAFPVKHASWPSAFGYRFDAADRSVVISGDAAPSEVVVAHCDGCDVLVHEVYSGVSFERRAPQWQRYHASAHTSAIELADLARRARPELLVLYHQLLWGTSPEELVDEIRQVWDGEVAFGVDLGVY
jgi:ribonuclease BN (tRNA processing enzyme)